jgi:hypothetical protein
MRIAALYMTILNETRAKKNRAATIVGQKPGWALIRKLCSGDDHGKSHVVSQ